MIAALLCLARAVSAVARLSIGPVLPLLAGDIHIDLAAKGQLLSAFSTGYLLTQVIGGRLADSCSAKLVVLVGLVATALLLALAPLAASAGGVVWLAAIFFALGALNGPLFPACSVMLRAVPPQGRAGAMAIVDAGGTLGGCLATAACPVIATVFGWKSLYYALAVASAAAALCWALLAEDPPAKDSLGKDHAGKAKAKSVQQSNVPAEGPRAVLLLGHCGPWALFFSHAVFNYSNYFLNAWLPSVFVERFGGMTPASAGVYLMWPEVFGIAMRFAAAAAVEHWILGERGRCSLLKVRKIASATAFLVQGIALAFAIRQPSPFNCTVLLVLAACAAACHACGFKANYLDLTTEHSGVLAGVGNTLASVASAIGPMITAKVLERYPGSWTLLFNGLCALNFVGAGVCVVWMTVDNLDRAVAAGDGGAFTRLLRPIGSASGRAKSD